MSSTTSVSSEHNIPNKEKDHNDQPPSPAAPPDLEKQLTNKSTIEHEYLTGLKLWIMMSGVTLVCFLMLLDMSIVSTVFNLPPTQSL